MSTVPKTIIAAVIFTVGLAAITFFVLSAKAGKHKDTFAGDALRLAGVFSAVCDTSMLIFYFSL